MDGLVDAHFHLWRLAAMRVPGIAANSRFGGDIAWPDYAAARGTTTLAGAVAVNWPGLLLLAASPQLALLAQLGLSRVREFDADRLAAELTGDPQGLASALAKIERVSRSWRAWLWPGWGNPEPSWLRTHPATQDRISRLLTLAPGPATALPFHAPHFLPESAVTPRPPRWRPSGLWR